MKSRTLNFPNSSRGNCLSREQHLCKGFVALMKFSKCSSVCPDTDPFSFGSPQPLFLSYLVSGPSITFSLPFHFLLILFSGNHHGLRIFSITQKFFHYYKSSQGGKQNMHGLSDESKVGRVSSCSLMAKSEGCREGWKT